MRLGLVALVIALLAGCSTEVGHLTYDDRGVGVRQGVLLLRDPPRPGEYRSIGERSYSFYRPGWHEPTISDVWDDLAGRIRSAGGDACLVKYQYVSTWTARSIDVTCDVLQRVGEVGTNAAATTGPTLAPSATGKFGYAAERFAKDQRCVSAKPPSLIVSGSGFETYSIACTVGEPLLVRCEFGNCRALR